MALNLKQARFAAEYLKDCNATQAAIRAGYAAKNADVTGSRLLGNVGVAAAVAAGQKRVASKLDLSAEKVLTDIARVAGLAERNEDYGPALKGHELLGKHLALFTDKVEHSGSVYVVSDSGTGFDK